MEEFEKRKIKWMSKYRRMLNIKRKIEKEENVKIKRERGMVYHII